MAMRNQQECAFVRKTFKDAAYSICVNSVSTYIPLRFMPCLQSYSSNKPVYLILLSAGEVKFWRIVLFATICAVFAVVGVALWMAVGLVVSITTENGINI